LLSLFFCATEPLHSRLPVSHFIFSLSSQNNFSNSVFIHSLCQTSVLQIITMSARPVVKTSYMNVQMQEFAIQTAQEAILKFTTEQEIASAIKESFEAQYPSV
jgi:hypothetical protein